MPLRCACACACAAQPMGHTGIRQVFTFSCVEWWNTLQVRFFTNSPQHKNANIAHFVLSLHWTLTRPTESATLKCNPFIYLISHLKCNPFIYLISHLLTAHGANKEGN